LAGCCGYIRPMQTALHVMALVAELEKEIIGGTLTAADFYKKQRAAFFCFKKGKNLTALGFVYHPAGYGVFIVPASKIKIDTDEKPRPLFKSVSSANGGLEGAVVTHIKQLGFDRIFQIFLNKDGQIMSILLEALGPNGNVWLLDAQHMRLASLRKRTFARDDSYRAPSLPDKLNPKALSVASFTDRLEQQGGASLPLVGFIEKNILGFDRILAREVIIRSGTDVAKVQDLDSRSLETVVNSIHDVVTHFEHPEVGYMHNLIDGPAVYPFRLSLVEKQPERFKSLSLAVQTMTVIRRTQIETVDEVKRIKDAVRRAVKRLERRGEKIEQDVKNASDYKRHKKMGELLQINFGKIKRGMTEIALEDVYAQSPDEITIRLDPALSPSENVEACFKKYRKGRQGLKLLKRRLVITKEELAQLSTIQSELEKDFESARRRHDQEITTLLPRKTTRPDTRPRLPYREYTLATGVRIFVGRGGADNDHTTFGFARPYELWFHAQQCPGSHVVMKFSNKSFEPSKLEIKEAAAVAAYFSKARKDSLVPVIYTQRRYVRKPRKARPGLVTVEREKSVMVVPQKPSQADR
jgi:predicted ribosome quality control (RQC) complex YloA/Tae2 family protein